jgi:FkbM family methyltransferase
MANDMPVEDLIYDIGMHRGEDTALYLAMGYRVVAFEANPDLCADARERFADAIAAGRVTLVEGAIAPGEGRVTFYRHAALTVFGTINPSWVERNEPFGGSVAMTVAVVDLAAQLAATGMPYYMKIDVEGSDLYCLEVLRGVEERPAYVSIESCQSDWRELEREFDVLDELGYSRFCVVQQEGLNRSALSATTIDGKPLTYRLEEDTSGPFGRDLARWETRRAAIRRYRAIYGLYRLLGDGGVFRRSRLGSRIISRLERSPKVRPLPGWYDTHARHRSDLD